MIILRERMMPRGEVYGLQMPGRGAPTLQFRLGHIGNMLVCAAQFDGDDPRAPVVAERIARLEGFSVHGGADHELAWGHPDDATQEVAPKPVADHSLHPLGHDALARGWSRSDLLGTGIGNDPTEHGGISPRTGLSMSEMALSRCPQGWEDAADTHYPWELPDWATDIIDFRPRNPPAKRELEQANTEDSDPVTSAELPAGSASTDDRQTPPEEPGETTPPDIPTTIDELRPAQVPAELADYALHVGLIQALMQASGEAPSIHQFGYRQRTLGLAKVDTDTFSRLLEAAANQE